MGIAQMVTHHSFPAPLRIRIAAGPSPYTARTLVYSSGVSSQLYTCMLIVCLRSRSSWTIQDSLGFLTQRLHGWFSIRNDCVDYFVPEPSAYLLYLIDPQLERYSHLDYID